MGRDTDVSLRCPWRQVWGWRRSEPLSLPGVDRELAPGLLDEERVVGARVLRVGIADPLDGVHGLVASPCLRDDAFDEIDSPVASEKTGMGCAWAAEGRVAFVVGLEKGDVKRRVKPRWEVIQGSAVTVWRHSGYSKRTDRKSVV